MGRMTFSKPFSLFTRYTTEKFSRREILAISSLSDSSVERLTSLLARRWSKLTGSTSSVNFPVRRSTTLETTRSLKTASTFCPSSDNPAAERTLRLKSSDLLAICVGRNKTAAADTITEHTIHSNKVTMIVFLMDSLLATCQPPLNIRLYNKVIDQRGKQVGKQDCQHHTFGEGRVYHTNNNHHKTYKRTKPQL